MTKKEFYIAAFIVIYTYLAIIFQVNVKNFISVQKREEPTKITFNAFR